MACFKRFIGPLLIALLLVIVGSFAWWHGSTRTSSGPTPSASFGPSASLPSAQGVTFVDDLGRSISVKTPVRRLVVFNRYNVEFVRAVAGTDPIVGIDAGTAKERAYWPTLRDVAIVGQGQSTPNYDAVANLAPDLVIIPRNGAWAEAERLLTPLGIPVAVVTAWDVLKHDQNAALLGQIFDKPKEAEALAAFYRHWRNVLEERLKGVTRKRVYLEEIGDYRTLLPGSGWHDMIEMGGGLNVFRDVTISAGNAARGTSQGFTVDPEDVIGRQPDVIIKLQPGQYAPHPRAFSRTVLERMAQRPGFQTIPAVRDGQIYHISYYLAGGSSKIIGALQVAKWLYPERFTDIDPEDVMAQWLTRFQHVPAQYGYTASLRDVQK